MPRDELMELLRGETVVPPDEGFTIEDPRLEERPVDVLAPLLRPYELPDAEPPTAEPPLPVLP